MPPELTAAAQRALRRATRLARHFAAAEVTPLHLLMALLQEESRAADCLARHGIDELAFESPIPVLPEEEPGETVTPVTMPPVSEGLNQVQARIRRYIGRQGQVSELGTEHLLWGLLAVESSASSLLQQYGVEVEPLLQQTAANPEPSHEPLPADFQLELAPAPASDLTDAWRTLDAAANRTREGIRVLEDFVRFTLDDRHLTELLKAWRHRLSTALRQLPSADLLSARETRGDVGTRISTTHERLRESIADVVTANCKRVQEGMRTLEEYSKIVSAELSQTLEALRYETYVFEKAIQGTLSSRTRLQGRNLYLLLSEELCPRGSGPVIRQALEAGVDIVQVREKQMPDRLLLEHARRVREWTRATGALLIMNDRPDLALLAEADGVHVGQEELTVRDARRILGPGKIVGVSTHTIEQARQAVLDGADYIGVGPTFTTTTKNFSALAGLEFVRQVAEEITLPAFAIGGIREENLDEVLAAGLSRVAVSSAICSAIDPKQATTQLRQRMTRG